MNRPQPPKPAWTPDLSVPTQASVMDAFQPLSSPLRIEDLSPFADPLGAPILGASSSSEDVVLCESCARCWKLSIAGQFKNKKADGSDYILTERFCVFKGSLVSLAERIVKDCSRFKQKEE